MNDGRGTADRDLDDLRRRSAALQGLARCELVEILDGPARGQRRLEIDTPSGLSATLVVDRALDVLSLRHRGVNLGWRSAARARHPVPDLESETGLALMRAFDGLLVTCGLDHTGLPTRTDAAALAYPPRAEHVHPLHGRLASAGVSLTGHGVDWERADADGGPCAWASAEAYQGGTFTEELVLYRRVELSLTEPVLRVRDRVVNEGWRPTRHRLLYHVNLGHPLLGEDARLTGEGWALSALLDGGDGPAGASPADEHVEIVDAGPTPRAPFGLANPALGLAVDLDTDARTLPVTAVWRAFRSGVFALGIEPQTRSEEENGAELAPLGARETRSYRLNLRVRAVRQLRSTSS